MLGAGDLLPRVLDRLALAPGAVALARLAVRCNGSDLERELVCSGAADEEAIALAVADVLGLATETPLPGDRIVADAGSGGCGSDSFSSAMLRTCDRNLRPKLFLAPRLEELGIVSGFLTQYPLKRELLRIATPRALARHRAASTLAARSETACAGLSTRFPSLSAREVITGPQGMALASITFLLATLAWHVPVAFLLVLYLAATPLFLCAIYWRLAAAAQGRHGSTALAVTEPPTVPPVYSVLVALHQEAEMVPALVEALAALRWPRSRLEILLVCEADDMPTVAAVEAAIRRRPEFEIVRVPASHPRTKPKALNVALPLCSGEFLVIFDAEDRPHPDQLQAAWAAFRQGDARLACLQASLVVGNAERSWLSGHFALEYGALFRGLLPWLAQRGLPVPLGGTSNHFRREALVAIGGWDSHNVTEDADLGIRLARRGYAIGTIDVPTIEDGPELWPIWLKQRTRWMKGWLQTWLVHMRNPVRLWHELGPRGFCALQILFFGMLGSALAHPLSVLLVAYTVGIATMSHPLSLALLAVDAVTLALGYIAYGMLLKASNAGEHHRLPPLFWSVYLYWLLTSIAVLRALFQLVQAPHRWEKTPHGASAAKPGPPELVAREQVAAAGTTG